MVRSNASTLWLLPKEKRWGAHKFFGGGMCSPHARRLVEAYLAEAQRLSHTGSWAWKVGAKQQFWSVETFQIYGFDPNAITPTRENFLERVHPDDRSSIELVETELYKGNDAEYNYRIIL